VSARFRVPLHTREAIVGYLYITPWILGFLVFVAGPMLASAVLSLYRYTIIGTPRFIGLANYETALTNDPTLGIAVWNTTYFTLLSVPLAILGSLALALLLNHAMRGISVLRLLYFIPSIIPSVAAVVVWSWIFNTDVGILNYLLSLGGIGGPPWLVSTEWVKPAIIAIVLWSSLGGGRMIIFLAGLQGVPKELYEAAAIDGATGWQRFFRITLPMISPSLFFNLLLGLIGATRMFTEAFFATEGGPANASLTYIIYLYKNAFGSFQMGYASALAWIFFVAVVTLTYVQFRFSRRWVYYAGETSTRK
jgi:multiple sugar transport system permease protein